MSFKNTFHKVLLVLSIFLLTTNMVFAQSLETMYTHFDKPFYAAGESIWFKTYVFKDSSRIRSRVLHVELVSPENEIITRQKLLINANCAYSKLALPLEAKHGYYRFRAFTHNNLGNDPTAVFEQLIAVYRPGQSIAIAQDTTSTYDSVQTTPLTLISPERIKIDFDKSSYQARESMTVSLNLNVQDSTEGLGIGNFSVSIIPESLLMPYLNQTEANSTHNPITSNAKLAAQRSLYIQGQLVDRESKDPAPPQVITLYMDKSPDLMKSYTTEDKIKIPVYDFWGEGEFQIMNLASDSKYQFVLDDGNEFTSPYFNTELPPMDSTIYRYLQNYEQRRQIMGLFTTTEVPKVDYSERVERIPDAVYRTEDYQDIYSLEEFINEAIGNVKVRSVRGVKTIRLFNREEGDPYTQHPWYLVDGFMTFNESQILDIQYKDIVEIRLYAKTSTVKNYFKHFMWNSGVMEIITRDVKYSRNFRNASNIIKMQGFEQVVPFDSLLTIPTDRITPDLRSLILWNPTVYTNNQGFGQLRIPLSDETGRFALIIEGLDGSNRLIKGFSTFEVTTK